MSREKLKPKSSTEFQNLNTDSESILSVMAMYLGAAGVNGGDGIPIEPVAEGLLVDEYSDDGSTTNLTEPTD
jgi:hypothetical protein